MEQNRLRRQKYWEKAAAQLARAKEAAAPRRRPVQLPLMIEASALAPANSAVNSTTNNDVATQLPHVINIESPTSIDHLVVSPKARENNELAVEMAPKVITYQKPVAAKPATASMENAPDGPPPVASAPAAKGVPPPNGHFDRLETGEPAPAFTREQAITHARKHYDAAVEALNNSTDACWDRGLRARAYRARHDAMEELKRLGAIEPNPPIHYEPETGAERRARHRAAFEKAWQRSEEVSAYMAAEKARWQTRHTVARAA